MAKGKVKTGVVKPLFTFSFRPTIEADAAGGADMKTVSEPGMGTLEIFPLATGELFLHDLIEDLFENHWRDIVFGSLIQGAVFEIRAPNAPTRISLLDDYLTVNFGAWHFHLCIGAHKGSRANPTDAALADHRRTARAELYRVLDRHDAPTSWGLRLMNGAGEQQMTIFLPNPFLNNDDQILKEADWSRLALWDDLHQKHLGLGPDDRDRAAKGFYHG